MAEGRDKKKPKGKGAKGARAGLVKALKALGVKNVTPEIIRAAGDLTGSKATIDFLRKPSEEEIYYGNAVGRLKSDEEIDAEQAGAYERTRQIAQDAAISVPALTSGFTSALGGLAGDLAAFGGGDARALVGLESAGQSAAGGIVTAGQEAQGVSASVRDLIAANADVFAAQAKQIRDEKREELLKSKRTATSERKKALVAAQAGAQSGLLSNLTTLLGLAPAGSGYGGGYGGGGGGRSGGGGNRPYTFSWEKANADTVTAGRGMEGLMGNAPSDYGSGQSDTAGGGASGPTTGYNVAAAGNVGPSINTGTPRWQPGSGQSYNDWQQEQKDKKKRSRGDLLAPPDSRNPNWGGRMPSGRG